MWLPAATGGGCEQDAETSVAIGPSSAPGLVPWSSLVPHAGAASDAKHGAAGVSAVLLQQEQRRLLGFDEADERQEGDHGSASRVDASTPASSAQPTADAAAAAAPSASAAQPAPGLSPATAAPSAAAAQPAPGLSPATAAAAIAVRRSATAQLTAASAVAPASSAAAAPSAAQPTASSAVSDATSVQPTAASAVADGPSPTAAQTADAHTTSATADSSTLGALQRASPSRLRQPEVATQMVMPQLHHWLQQLLIKQQQEMLQLQQKHQEELLLLLSVGAQPRQLLAPSHALLSHPVLGAALRAARVPTVAAPGAADGARMPSAVPIAASPTAAAAAAAAAAASPAGAASVLLQRQRMPRRDEESLCVVCMDAERCMTLLPCRHRVLCRSCAGSVRAKNDECPMCRCPIKDAVSE
ncbi:hypothetical protein FOA52_003992 [Chlamydomonas sp. UWO 241]|nr:hypothetical protein FOA52_003992 [Chlamydomonas sp. UWO 241]